MPMTKVRLPLQGQKLCMRSVGSIECYFRKSGGQSYTPYADGSLIDADLFCCFIKSFFFSSFAESPAYLPDTLTP